MKLGILGTGMIVKDLLSTIHELAFDKVVLLATEQTQKEAQEMVESYGLDDVYINYDELLKSDVDTIYVALPNHLHYAFAKKALEADKNVIVEKPFTSNSKEAQELVDLAKNKQCFLFEAMTVHYMPAMLQLKKDVMQLGKMKIISLNYSQYSSRYDAFKQGQILPAFDYHKSGGALYDLNVYNIHFVLDLFGQPKEVNYYPNIERGIDTSGVLILDYDNFKAVLIGAKDCRAPLMNTLQANQGHVVITTPVSRLRDYQVSQNQHEEHKTFTSQTHAMYYEFKEMKRMIEDNDHVKADAMLKLSLMASQVMTEARRKAGIVFDADKD
ncbi:MAG: Gfo/Idh/MocA family oxidoreductase [Sharpea porci]|uniref:Gfo/Idh/MocA family protein n=1 Tax=Sharpea porci TaxID=2652286 RepID=UPI00240A9426|nr:Gfo/Idh/MocA family oxidoreductase [Sharpea porci]MDD6711389.1 Gfo/Idh/MocA family oxidoreductase [Sharpea porci]